MMLFRFRITNEIRNALDEVKNIYCSDHVEGKTEHDEEIENELMDLLHNSDRILISLGCLKVVVEQLKKNDGPSVWLHDLVENCEIVFEKPPVKNRTMEEKSILQAAKDRAQNIQYDNMVANVVPSKDDTSFRPTIRTGGVTIVVDVFIGVVTMFFAGYVIGGSFLNSHTDQLIFGLICGIVIFFAEVILLIIRFSRVDSYESEEKSGLSTILLKNESKLKTN